MLFFNILQAKTTPRLRIQPLRHVPIISPPMVPTRPLKQLRDETEQVLSSREEEECELYEELPTGDDEWGEKINSVCDEKEQKVCQSVIIINDITVH